MTAKSNFDVIIVGSGIAGALTAKHLGSRGHSVLILEAGAGIPTNNEQYMERFFTANAKVPESPYTPPLFDPDTSQLQDQTQLNAGRPTVLTLDASNWQNPTQSYLIQEGPLAFASTYERIAGGTTNHWLGTSLRNVPNDFNAHSIYGHTVDWPINYDDLTHWYNLAESEIGVSASTADQAYEGVTFTAGYEYPMQAIPLSKVDLTIKEHVDGMSMFGKSLSVKSTPAARNSEPYQGRRACAGNTNCIPICPIQAKYDASVTLKEALNTGNVTIWPKTIATELISDDINMVTAVKYRQYTTDKSQPTPESTVHGIAVILAAHAIETPRLLLMSTNEGKTPNGLSNSSDQVGRNLMDHPLYLAWAQSAEQIYPYRGPLATAGIEDLRDGDFRSDRAAFRIEIGNEGWNFSEGDPTTTAFDFIVGTNASGLNPDQAGIGYYRGDHGTSLVNNLNQNLTKQFRLGFLVEQTPEQDNRVTLDHAHLDHLGLPRAKINYDLSDYTKKGFLAAKQAATAIFDQMGATEFTTQYQEAGGDPTIFSVDNEAGQTEFIKFYGAGHVVGTCRMGSDHQNSVVNSYGQSWDNKNLYIVGSSIFPTVATANPTLTIAALALRTAQHIDDEFNNPDSALYKS